MPNEAYLSTWNTYQKAWANISPAERQDLLSSSVAEDCIYTDPGAECHGLKELIAHIEQFQQQFPGTLFHNDKFTDHHAQGLFNWTWYGADGTTVASTGTSYARFDKEGLLTQMTGFF